MHSALSEHRSVSWESDGSYHEIDSQRVDLTTKGEWPIYAGVLKHVESIMTKSSHIVDRKATTTTDVPHHENILSLIELKLRSLVGVFMKSQIGGDKAKWAAAAQKVKTKLKNEFCFYQHYVGDTESLLLQVESKFRNEIQEIAKDIK